MSVTPEDFLSYAQDMLDKDINEFELRCCIRTSYYGAYHKSNSLKMLGEINKYPGLGVHACLIRHMSEIYTKDRKNLRKKELYRAGLKLNHIKSNRTKADYLLDEDIMLSEVKLHLDTVKQIFDICNEIEANDVDAA